MHKQEEPDAYNILQGAFKFQERSNDQETNTFLNVTWMMTSLCRAAKDEQG